MSPEKDEILIDGEGAKASDASKPPKKALGKKMIILLGGAMALLGAGGYFGYTFFFQEHAKSAQEIQKEKKNEKMILCPLDPFILNLSDPGRHLKVAVQFELKEVKDETLVKEKTPKLRDLVIMLISSKTVESVSSAEGKFQLKDEILLRANQAMGKETFRNVYFTDFVMQ